MEITNLVIPGENDSESEIDRMTGWIVENLGPAVPVHFSAFHPDWKMTDRPRTPVSTLRKARGIARSNGVRYAYTGNVHDEDGDTTCCHACGAAVIRRDWYELKAWNLDDQGACGECGATCAGLFDGPPGNWGSRRLPVRLADFEARNEGKR